MDFGAFNPVVSKRTVDRVCVYVRASVAALSLPHSSHVTGQTLLSGEPFIGRFQMCLSSSPIIQREIGIVTLWGFIQSKIEK